MFELESKRVGSTVLSHLKGFSRFLIKREKKTPDFSQNAIFVQRLRKDYSMKKFNSKRFLNKNTFGLEHFFILVSRSLDVSQHFNEHLSFYIFLKNSNLCAPVAERLLDEKI